MSVGANFDVVNGPTVNLNAVFAATDEVLLGGHFKYNTGLDEDRPAILAAFRTLHGC